MSHNYLVELTLDQAGVDAGLVERLRDLDPELGRERDELGDGSVRLRGGFHARGADTPAAHAERILDAAGASLRSLVIRDYEAGLVGEEYPIVFEHAGS